MDHDEILVSFEVKSLFTNVPTYYAKQCVKDIIQSNLSLLHSKTKLSVDDILELLDICTNATLFSWQNNIYK